MIHDILLVDWNEVHFLSSQRSGVDDGQQPSLLLSTVSAPRQLQALSSEGHTWGMWLCQCSNHCVCAEGFTSQSHARARPLPSQKPHLEATCAQDLGGPEPGPKNSSGGFMQDWDGWINLAACQSFLITSTAYWCEFFRHIWLIREVEHLVISRGYIHGITSAWVNWALLWETWLQGSWKPNTFSALLQFLYCFINFVNQGIPWVHTQCPI